MGLKENLDLRKESNSDSDSVSGFDGNGSADEAADVSRPADALLELTPQSSRLIVLLHPLLSPLLPPLFPFVVVNIMYLSLLTKVC